MDPAGRPTPGCLTDVLGRQPPAKPYRTGEERIYSQKTK